MSGSSLNLIVNKYMVQHAFKVADHFAIRGRGLIVVTDKTYEQLGPNFVVKIGDPVEFRRDNQVMLRSTVEGIEHCNPWSPNRPFVFSLPPDISKEDVPFGTEIWLDER